MLGTQHLLVQLCECFNRKERHIKILKFGRVIATKVPTPKDSPRTIRIREEEFLTHKI